MEKNKKAITKLLLYNVINSVASSSYSPFLSFIGAALGLPGYLLGIISTSGTFFTNISQYISSLSRKNPKSLILFGNILKSLALIALFVLTTQGPLYTLFVALIMVGSGISGLGLSLLMELHSRTSRSVILSRIYFYSSLASLPIIVLGGLYLEYNTLLVKYVFLLSAFISLLSTFIVINVNYSEDYNKNNGIWINKEDYVKLKKFFLFNLLYMITWSFAWPLFPLAQVYIFHMNTFQVAIINIISLGSTILLQRYFGYFIAKHTKLSLFIGRFTNTFFALAYAISPNVEGIYLANVLGGVANSINNVGYFSYLVDNSKDKRAAIGTYSVIMGFSALIGGEIGGITYDFLEPKYGYSIIRKLFLFTAIARASAASLFLLL